jgi:hypothetical protein
MTFWDFLSHLGTTLEAHATRMLGVAVGTLTALTSTGIVPESHLKYYLAAIAILTYWRGQSTSNTVNGLKAQIATPLAPGVTHAPLSPPHVSFSDPKP